MGTTTTNLNLYEPSVGETGWGTLVNGNFTTLDQALVNPTPSVTGTLTAAGLVDISGVSAGQIKFPATQNPSANANTLDDYAEGTWTPTVSFNNGSTGVTYGTQTGRYTKIGRQVFVEFQVILTSKGSSTGSARVAGLPFVVGGTGSTCPLFWNTMTSAMITMTGAGETGVSRMLIYGLTAGAATLAPVADTAFANTTQLTGCLTYTV